MTDISFTMRPSIQNVIRDLQRVYGSDTIEAALEEALSLALETSKLAVVRDGKLVVRVLRPSDPDVECCCIIINRLASKET